jgi:zinc protease
VGDDDALGLLASILSDGDGSRLNRELKVKHDFAVSVRADQDSHDLSSVFSIGITLEAKANPDDVLRMLDAELARVLHEPVSDDELRRAKTRYETSLVRQLEPVMARAEILQSLQHTTGDAASLPHEVEHIRALTAADLQAAAVHWLSKPRVVVVTHPQPTPPSTAPTSTASTGSKP